MTAWPIVGAKRQVVAKQHSKQDQSACAAGFPDDRRAESIVYLGSLAPRIDFTNSSDANLIQRGSVAHFPTFLIDKSEECLIIRATH